MRFINFVYLCFSILLVFIINKFSVFVDINRDIEFCIMYVVVQFGFSFLFMEIDIVEMVLYNFLYYVIQRLILEKKGMVMFIFVMMDVQCDINKIVSENVYVCEL